MVHPEMRVSEVLQRYPALLDELIAASPAFAKLKNPCCGVPCPGW